MKKDKFKKLRFQVRTMEPVEKPECCAMLLKDLTMEMPEKRIFSIEESQQRRLVMEDGTLVIEVAAKGLRTSDTAIQHLRLGKQAEIFDYNYFKSKTGGTVVTEIGAELFDFSKGVAIPFELKRLEFSFNNGKKVDFTNKVSVWSLDQLAS